MSEFLARWSALIIAGVALVQVWFIALVKWLWKEFVKPGKIGIHKSGTIEVNYGDWGATIGLHGTFRALNRDLFVSTAWLELENLENKPKHKLEWILFRPPTAFAGESEVPVEPASGFMVRVSEPRRYNILFTDREIGENILLLLEDLKKKWQDAGAEAGQLDLLNKYTDPEERKREIKKVAQELYPQFREGEDVLEIQKALANICPWEAGRYKLVLVVETANPTRQFKKGWEFYLAKENADFLRWGNPLGMIDRHLGQGYFKPAPIFIRYKEIIS